MSFLSQTHYKKFSSFREQLQLKDRKNIKVLSFLFLVSGHEVLQEKAYPYFDVSSCYYDFKSIFENEILAPGIEVLVKISISLFEHGYKIDLNEIEKLSQEELKLALSCIAFRFDIYNGLYDSDQNNFMIIK